ncbi:MAG: CDP-diacylglycerol--glycerol-3-phosphate 3-phosphatidyltransferase [Victivallales bacterium]|jgi:CDP-diacylglycerol---serine O-phosphatidyltransferase|nr:CDP-diacylglycerol--glycerol-3-phosphate 3-phosphatidyltransferase [Victivallales bacterium]MBT7165349.1 CDP-diacylglycerol--glycerol-3-phosphate 3-phosphatidyltransferase [Victivallales bacterium]MBT7302667.1 CDP-diacylglycerol--glycerol-3-phosphate 3-phosphatidyltransferase [Victivallales bacterium]
MWKSLTILIAVAFMLAFERVAIGLMTRCESGRRWIVRHRFMHPNSISLIRIPMGLVSILLLWLEMPSTAILWFAFWMITDLTDGTIARCCDLTTETGKWLDPLSDKCMYFPVLLYFAIAPVPKGLPLLWVLALIVIDSVGQASRLFSAKKAANYFGKAKTALVTILLSVLGLDIIGEVPFLGEHLLQLLTATCTILAFFSLYCKVIPDNWYANSMTLANFVCGLASICRVHAGEPVQALILIFAGQMFDLFDGRLARRFGSTRRGPMYDDIADGTSFGFALGYLIYWLLAEYGLPVPLASGVAILYVFAVIYRLYRFLHPTREMPPGIFQGMPAPAGAMLAGSSVLLCSDVSPWWSAVLVVLTALLLVSSIPYRHFGQHMWPSLPRTLKLLFGLLLLIFVNLAIANREYAILFRRYCFLMASLYAVSGIDYRGARGRRRKDEPEGE